MAFTGIARSRNTETERESTSRPYSSIDEMDMASFIAVECDGDLARLYAEKDPVRLPEKEEKEAAEKLYIQFVERMNGSDMGMYEEERAIVLSQSAVAIIDCCIRIYGGDGADIGIIRRVMRGFGVAVTGDPSKDIPAMASARDRMIRKTVRMAEERKNRTCAGGTVRKREHYMRLMASMSSHFRFNVSLSVKVGEFCALYRQFCDEIKAVKNKKKQNTYGGKH